MQLFLSSEAGERYPLDEPLVTVGRAPGNRIRIQDVSVSRRHAEIACGAGGWVLRDLGSSNGTRVNGAPVAVPTALAPGDTVHFGSVPLRVLGDELTPRLTLTETSRLGATLKLPADRLIERRARTAEGARQLIHLLAEAGHQMVLPQPLASSYDEMIRFVEKAVPASRYILLAKPADGDELVPVACRTRGGPSGEPLVLSQAILRTVIEESCAVLTRNAAPAPRPGGSDDTPEPGVCSAVAVPLYDGKRLHGVLYVDSRDPGLQLGESQLEILSLLGDMMAVKISNTQLLEKEQAGALLRQQMAMAAGIQRGLLPPAPPAPPGYETEAFLEPSQAVGGDLYDFHACPDGGLVFVIGDVSGKGLPAALLMALFLASLRVLYEYCSDLAELAARLSEQVYRGTDPMHYVTGVIGRLDPATGRLRYVNAGHPPPLVVGAGGVRALESTGVPFGILPDAGYEIAEAELAPGELLVAFSDGVTEAGCAGRFFEESRLRAALPEVAREERLAGARSALVRRVDEFLAGAPRGDDLTLVLIRREAPAPA